MVKGLSKALKEAQLIKNKIKEMYKFVEANIYKNKSHT